MAVGFFFRLTFSLYYAILFENYLENKMNLIEEYKKFLENGKTERECVSLIIHLAEKKWIQGHSEN